MIKNHIREFIRRGLIACGFGPLVLCIYYLGLYHKGVVDTLSVPQICLEIFSLSLLAFIAGGMNFIYQIEQLPLMVAALIHGMVLYMGYLGVYLLNGWLKQGSAPIIIFSVIFIVGYLVIWGIIYSVTKKNTKKVNDILHKRNHPQK
jgi:hypothetical protein